MRVMPQYPSPRLRFAPLKATRSEYSFRSYAICPRRRREERKSYAVGLRWQVAAFVEAEIGRTVTRAHNASGVYLRSSLCPAFRLLPRGRP